MLAPRVNLGPPRTPRFADAERCGVLTFELDVSDSVSESVYSEDVASDEDAPGGWDGIASRRARPDATRRARFYSRHGAKRQPSSTFSEFQMFVDRAASGN